MIGGANGPLWDEISSVGYSGSLNHGYAIERASLDEASWGTYFRHLNDGSLMGLYHKEKPVLSVQFHPEGASH